jgi:hypothetical protein
MAILEKNADNSNNNVIMIPMIPLKGNQRVSNFLTGCKREKTGTLLFPGGIPQGLRCKVKKLLTRESINVYCTPISNVQQMKRNSHVGLKTDFKKTVQP